jgi:hypothetical protein
MPFNEQDKAVLSATLQRPLRLHSSKCVRPMNTKTNYPF